MKPLPTHFQHDGFNCRVMERVGDVVLIAKRAPHHSRETFEVCIVRRCPTRVILDREIAAHEALPSPEHWGTYGWSYPDLARARSRFTKLVNQRPRGNVPAIATPSPSCVPEPGGSSRTPDNPLRTADGRSR